MYQKFNRYARSYIATVASPGDDRETSSRIYSGHSHFSVSDIVYMVLNKSSIGSGNHYLWRIMPEVILSLKSLQIITTRQVYCQNNYSMNTGSPIKCSYLSYIVMAALLNYNIIHVANCYYPTPGQSRHRLLWLWSLANEQ